MTLALYFAKRFLVSFIRVFFGIVLLVLLFDFLTNLNRLNGIENQVWNALILSFLRTTTYLSLAMPLIIMLSTLAFSVSLSRSNEFIISRASGLSALRSIFSVLICAFILGLISIFILDPTAGRMIGYYDVKLDTLRSKKQSKVTINDNGYWMRQSTLNGHQIIKAASASNNGQRLNHVSIFNYDKNGLILDRFFSEYALLNKNAFSIKDNFNFGRLNGFIEGKGSFALRKNYIADFNLDLANTIDFANGEKPFKNNYDYAEPEDDRLRNSFDISKTTPDSFFQLGTSFTQSFRFKDFNGDGSKEEDPNVPLILPEYYFKKNFYDTNYAGKYSLTAQSVNLTNLNTGQYSRIGGIIDWKTDWQTNNGFNFATLTQLNANTYFIDNNFYKNAMPLAMIEARYPLKKTNKKASHLIEPITQIIWSPNQLTGYLNNNQNTSDSTTAEFEETNLFSTNRFPGFDDVEAGLRANIGGKYIMYDPNGWEFTTTAGRVFRQKDLNQFDASKSTGLDKLNSDYVSAFSLKSPQNLKVLTRLLLDDSMDASKHETKLGYSSKKYSADLGYVWLDKQSVLNLDNHQHEVNISTNYMVNNNWKLGADWRQNIDTHSPISGNFAIMFENDCAKMNFSLDLQYDDQDRIDRTFGMQIFLSGLGSNSNKKKFNNRCGG